MDRPDHNVHELLSFYSEAGIDVALQDEPVNRFATPEVQTPSATPEVAKGVENRSVPSAGTDRPAPAPPVSAGTRGGFEPKAVPDAQAVEAAEQLAAKAQSLEELHQAIAQFDRCNLRFSARTTIVGEGPSDADLMIIGDLPEASEDEHGQPFVGMEGQLLDKMLHAIGLERSALFLTCALPWRPPGKRAPTPIEIEICRPFLLRQMELVSPSVVLMMGSMGAHLVLKSKGKVNTLRGKWMNHQIGDKSVDALVTFHPNHLLANPLQKKWAWRDLLLLDAHLKGKEGSDPEQK